MNHPKTANELARTLAFHIETGLTQARMALRNLAREQGEAEPVNTRLCLDSAIEQYEEIRQKLAAVEAAPQVTSYCPNCEASGREVARIAEALPDTWYARSETWQRVLLLVEQWRRLHGLVKATVGDEWEDAFLPYAPPTEAEFLKMKEQTKRYGDLSFQEIFDRLDAAAGINLEGR